MKRKVKTKKVDEVNEFEKKFIAFGNKKKVFWSITLITILLSILSTPIFFQYDSKNLLTCLYTIWVLEIVYIWLYFSKNRIMPLQKIYYSKD